MAETLPWAELEAEAARQDCSPADVFFDRAGRRVPGLTPIGGTPAIAVSDTRPIRTPPPSGSPSNARRGAA